MKSKYSFTAFVFILAISAGVRGYYIQKEAKEKQFCVTTYDAFGYYLYLPSSLIYHDVTELNWVAKIDSQYHVTGEGKLYQAIKEPNGRHVFKYLGGVAVLQLPFFAIGHAVAHLTNAPTDGFSLPYQYALVFGAFFYAFVGLFYLRRFLLLYFDDKTVAFTLLLLTIASNWVQYLAIDSAMSHIYIFPLYVFVLLATKRWHERPNLFSAFAVGGVIGLATICRPTEAVMLFIPLLWNTHNRATATQKWQLVQQNKFSIAVAMLGGLFAVAPQLLYWKYASGRFVYDVGSKWYFLNPYFRVLFGFEKGWFVYTPVTILFVMGLFFIRRYAFYRSVLVFCLLNILVVMA